MSKMIPYGKQFIDEDDIKAVTEVLRSDWLTTGPAVEGFEKAVAQFTEATHAVAVSNGTAALHAAMFAIDLKPGDEVLVPAITFVATSNSVLYQKGKPVFVDVDRETLLIDTGDLVKKITSKTKAIIAVDYAGLPCDYDALQKIAKENKLYLISDACHSLGAKYNGKNVGTLADLTVLSFHPVKHITTGEGGMVLTGDDTLATRMRRFRNHGISADFRQREAKGAFHYEMTDLGFNYRLTDIQAALGTSQLKKLPSWIEKRGKLACKYHGAFSNLFEVGKMKAQAAPKNAAHAYHLYVVQLAKAFDRSQVFQKLRASGIGANVHYMPVYLHPYYKELGYQKGLCPMAESVYEGLLSLPLHQGMTDEDLKQVIQSVTQALNG